MVLPKKFNRKHLSEGNFTRERYTVMLTKIKELLVYELRKRLYKKSQTEKTRWNRSLIRLRHATYFSC